MHCMVQAGLKKSNQNVGVLFKIIRTYFCQFKTLLDQYGQIAWRRHPPRNVFLGHITLAPIL